MRVAIILGTMLAAACAGTLVRPVINDSKANGIRYYESAPFLLVSPDGRGGVSSQIIFLQDTRLSAIRTIDPFAVLAKNETTLTFTNGVLSQSKSVIDETVVPQAAITALETVASAAIKLAGANDPTGLTDIPLPRLYRIAFDASGNVSLTGGQAFTADGTELRTIRATLTQAGSASAPPAAQDATKAGGNEKQGDDE